MNISCNPDIPELEVHSINEVEMCHYSIEASSSLVCSINPSEMPSDSQWRSRNEGVPENNQNNDNIQEIEVENNEHLEKIRRRDELNNQILELEEELIRLRELVDNLDV